MLLRGRGIAVIDIGLGALEHRPAVGIRLIGDGIGGLLALSIGVDKLLGICIDGLFQLFLKVTANYNAVFLTLYHKAADVAQELLPVQNVSVFVQGISLAVGLAAALAVYIGNQGRFFQGKAGLCLTVCGADNVFVCNGNVLTAGGDGIKVVALGSNLIGHVLIVKGLLAPHLGQQKLGLLGGAELLPVCSGIAEVLVFDHAHILLIHIGVGVELLILRIGANYAAQEGEQEHSNQHGKTNHSQPVPEKALGNQCAGRQDLNAAVIVQRKVLSFLSVLVFQFISIILHNKSRSFLTQCVPAGLPRRTKCRIADCQSGSE